MKTRKISKVTSNTLHQGFLGRGHTASAIVDGRSFPETDPFILLMDDRLDLPGGPPVGGPHPHAGFETVTFVLEGNGKEWKTGSMEIMTAGKGIVHTEEITSRQKLRILQLWLVLPPEKRWAEPFLQRIFLEDVPTVITDKSEIRVYSGSSNGVTSPIQNQAAFTLADFRIAANADSSQIIPAGYNGFIYVITGNVTIDGTLISEDQTGWLEFPDEREDSELTFKTGADGVRLILYAGQPQNAPVIQHGPFVGDTSEDIIRLYKEYRNGLMPHLNEIPESRKITYGKTAMF